jgi:mannonate dehydratase
MIRIGLVIGPFLTEERLKLAKQLGVDEIIGGIPYDQYAIEDYMYAHTKISRTDIKRPEIWDFESLLQMRKRIEDAGLKISIIDAGPPLDKAKLGLPGRDKQIENFNKSLKNMGAAGIHRLTFNFTPLSTSRTSYSTRIRGGAQATSFDYEQEKNAPLTEYGVVDMERMWDNWEYFIKRVIPVAEESDVRLALHPDDPPVPFLRGIARPFTSFEGFKRVIETVDSEYNGISFCMGCWAEMGEDVPKAIHYFGSKKRINFVHFRNIVGSSEKFVETFHDDGQTDMLACIRALKDVNYDGPIRPDHQPRTENFDSLPENSGYKLLGKFYAIGYMKGFIEAVYGKQPVTPLSF